MKQSLLTLSAAFALAGVSQAAILVENFDGYTNGTDMNGLGTWTVTNGSSGSGPIAIATNSTFEGSAGAVLIGGYTPTTSPTVLSTSGLDIPMFTVGNPAEFMIDFGIYDSLSADQDDYTITLASTSGNLLTIDLTPAGDNLYNISISSGFFAPPVVGTFDTLDVFGSPYSQIMFQTSTDGVNMFYNLVDLNSGSLSSGTLSGGGISLSDNITSLSISVDTAGGAGDGFLVMDNISVIPEPSSALLGILGASCVFLRRRRA